MRVFITLISFFCVVVSFSVFFTFKAQFNLFYPDKASTKIESLNEFNNQFSYFPNITAAAIPINAIKGGFAINERKYKLGDSLLDIAEKDNPYIGYTEYIKAKTFYALGNIDSSTFYAEKAFKKWPKSLDNYTMYLKTLAYQGDTLAIVEAFDYIDEIFKDRKIYSKEFVNYYTNAQLKYLITKYDDRSLISLSDLSGTWVKSFEYEGGKVQYDNSVRITFNQNQMISSSGVVYDVEQNSDTLNIFSSKSKKLITKNLVYYSKKYQTMILVSDPRTEKVEQFFKKTP